MSRPSRAARSRLVLEALAERVLPAVTASFTADGTVRVAGDDLDNAIVISRDVAGTILVNSGAVVIQGGPATLVNTNLILFNGGLGNDVLTLDETTGALPLARLDGGAGEDVLRGGSVGDIFVGAGGNDTLVGGAGDDTFIWSPGDGSDVVEGQGGRDVLTFSGSGAAEKFELSANGTRARFTRDVGGVVIDLNGVEEIDLSGLGGADTATINDQSTTGLNTFNVDLSSTPGTLDNETDAVIINGTNGNDVGQIRSIGARINATISAIPSVNITGEGGLDTLTVNTLGGNDVLDASDLAATNASQLITLTVNGGTGSDTLTGSQGADTFVWNPGDGSDTINGGDNPDMLILNGSDQSEKFDLSSNGGRVRLTRDVGGITMDVGGVETFTVNALGGADTVNVNDLTGTGVVQINVDLAAVVGDTAGDRQADAVIVNSRNVADRIPVLGAFVGVTGAVIVNGGFADGSGLPYFLAIRATEGALDSLTVNGQGGNDTVDATGLFATNASQLIKLTVNGGAGNDKLIGSPGSDTFVWNPGDGNDTIDGGDGLDLLTFNGSNLAETFVIARNGSHVGLTSDVGNVTLDLNAMDGIELNALGGADTITVNDLTGTGLVKVQLNLNGPAGGGDGQSDNVIVNGSNGDDAVPISGSALGVFMEGLFPLLRINGAEPTDRLTVNTLGGNDTVDSSALPPGVIGLTVNLGGDQPAAPRVTGVLVNGGAAQRSLVTQLRVAFDQHVTLPANPAGAFRLIRQGDGAAVQVSAAVDDSGTGTVVTLTFIGGAIEGVSLADGRYTLTVLAGQVSTVNGLLDGDGDGQAGGDLVERGDPASNKLFRLFGDVNGDGAVNGLDLTVFRSTFGAALTDANYATFLDVNGDGAINGLDLAQFRDRFGATV
jgi:Dockerin type I domain